MYINLIIFYRGKISLPCCISEPIVNHIEFINVKLFSNSSGSELHGCGFIHSPGAILKQIIFIVDYVYSFL
jgi:hypothetical protein